MITSSACRPRLTWLHIVGSSNYTMYYVILVVVHWHFPLLCVCVSVCTGIFPHSETCLPHSEVESVLLDFSKRGNRSFPFRYAK